MVNMIEGLRNDWLRLLSMGAMEVVEHTGHCLQQVQPGGVISAVRGVLAEFELRLSAR